MEKGGKNQFGAITSEETSINVKMSSEDFVTPVDNNLMRLERFTFTRM
jgi:hypothetical protein